MKANVWLELLQTPWIFKSRTPGQNYTFRIYAFILLINIDQYRLSIVKYSFAFGFSITAIFKMQPHRNSNKFTMWLHINLYQLILFVWYRKNQSRNICWRYIFTNKVDMTYCMKACTTYIFWSLYFFSIR